MPKSNLEQLVEAVLFVAEQPLSLNQLSRAVEVPQAQLPRALEGLRRHLAGRGIVLLENQDRYSLATSPAATPTVERYLQRQVRSQLSQPALETLAIIAYRQPITKGQIDAIRGVSSEQTLKNLLLRGLIADSGHSPAPGQPKLYATSTKFLRVFGLSRPSDLPPFEQSESENEA